MKYEIKSGWANNVLFEAEATCIRDAVEQAVKVNANLARANLAGAYLARANLAGVDLVRAKGLTESQLTPIRDDVWAVLSSAPREARAVLAAINAGRVDGSVYEGKCACLVGTIAKARGCNKESLGTLKPNPSRSAERWFMGIKKGDTPTTNRAAELAAKWIGEWIENMEAAFTPAGQGASDDTQ